MIDRHFAEEIELKTDKLLEIREISRALTLITNSLGSSYAAEKWMLRQATNRLYSLYLTVDEIRDLIDKELSEPEAEEAESFEDLPFVTPDKEVEA